LRAMRSLVKAYYIRPLSRINHKEEDDPYVPIGETWVSAPFEQGLNGYRNSSLAAWTMELLLEKDFNIREKMVLFWHNHFVTADINDPRVRYIYINTIRHGALGSFKDLTRKITVDPAMLRYLNGNVNRVGSPNENYARELLELFTVGKGELAAEGDYSTFTELDVKEIAKSLTGWVVRGLNNTNYPLPFAEFISNRHDKTTKQLSHRFDNDIIVNGEELEYNSVIDIIFKQDSPSFFLARKLYRYFIYYQITDEIEINIIQPLAKLIRDNDYHIKPALEALLSSAHFYDDVYKGVMIKTPLDAMAYLNRQFELTFPDELRPRYNYYELLFQAAGLSQMLYYQPPSVAGWSACYQEPSYYQIWINSVTLPYRMIVSDSLAITGIEKSGETTKIDALKELFKIEDKLNPNKVIDGFVRLLFPKDITQDQKSYLKNILIPGLPDFEWETELSMYLEDKSNKNLEASIEFKIRLLLRTMMTMPEFQLC